MVVDGEPVGRLDTLSIVFTDIVGSTALRADLGEDAAEVVRRAHDTLVAEVVAGHGGRVVKGLGDGFLATFGSAGRAVASAVGIQQGVDALRFPGMAVSLSIRVGISVGDVTVEDADVFGTPVIEASRLCSAAEPGQILATIGVELMAGNRGGYTTTPVGSLDLKGLPDPVPAVAIEWERRSPDAGVPLPHALTTREGAFPFCGRDSAVAGLDVAWKRVLHAGTKSCVLIAGEPGMGKTRLASEFAQRVHAEGAVVLFGRCDEELGAAYQPFIEALTYHASNLDAEQVAQLGTQPADLAVLAPDLAARFSDLGPGRISGDPELDQLRLFEAVDAWLAAGAGPRGLVLVLDDIHWATRPTLLLVRHVLRSSVQAPVLILATYRDTDLDRTHPLADVLADLRRVPDVERVALTGLDRVGIEDILEQVNQIELDDQARALAAAVHDETEGNPFFVGELLRHLAETGALVQHEGRWHVAVGLADVSLPDGIREVVGRRLSRLSEEANDVLSWAAVIGRELRLDVLAAVTSGQDHCLDALEEAVAARLLDEVAVGRWRFSHALVRTTLLAELRTTRKVRMHITIGETYEHLVPDDIAALARHFSEAAPLGVGTKAVGYLNRAGEDAIDGLAFDTAAALFEQAINIAADVELDEPGLAADAAIGRAIARRWSGHDIQDDLTQAFDLAAAIGDGSRMARALLDTSRGFAARVFEVDRVLVNRLEQCLVHLDDGDSPDRVMVSAALTMELTHSGDPQRLLTLSEQAIAMARRLDDPYLLTEALGARATAVAARVDHLDELPAIVDEMERSAQRALTSPHFLRIEFGSMIIAAGLAGWTGDRSLFQKCLDRTDALESLLPHGRWLYLGQRGGFELRWGTLPNAERLANELLTGATESGEPDALIWYLNIMAFALRQGGRCDEALALCEPVLETTDPDALLWPILAGIVAMLQCETERHDDARALAAQLYQRGRNLPRDTSFLPTLGPLAIVAIELADIAEVRWILTELEPLTAYWSAWSNLAPIAPVSTLVGRLRSVLGDFGGAESAFDDAVTHCRSTDSRFFLAEALLYQGLARHQAGQTGDTVTTPVTEARALAETGSYGTLHRRATAFLG